MQTIRSGPGEGPEGSGRVWEECESSWGLYEVQAVRLWPGEESEGCDMVWERCVFVWGEGLEGYGFRGQGCGVRKSRGWEGAPDAGRQVGAG